MYLSKNNFTSNEKRSTPRWCCQFSAHSLQILIKFSYFDKTKNNFFSIKLPIYHFSYVPILFLFQHAKYGCKIWFSSSGVVFLVCLCCYGSNIHSSLNRNRSCSDFFSNWHFILLQSVPLVPIAQKYTILIKCTSTHCHRKTRKNYLDVDYKAFLKSCIFIGTQGIVSITLDLTFLT